MSSTAVNYAVALRFLIIQPSLTFMLNFLVFIYAISVDRCKVIYSSFDIMLNVHTIFLSH